MPSERILTWAYLYLGGGLIFMASMMLAHRAGAIAWDDPKARRTLIGLFVVVAGLALVHGVLQMPELLEGAP